jgi:hypothetical protein
MGRLSGKIDVRYAASYRDGLVDASRSSRRVRARAARAVKNPIESDNFAPHRCECGNLLAKIVARGIEVKCRRCKRVVVIAFGDIEGWQQRTPSPV